MKLTNGQLLKLLKEYSKYCYDLKASYFWCTATWIFMWEKGQDDMRQSVVCLREGELGKMLARCGEHTKTFQALGEPFSYSSLPAMVRQVYSLLRSRSGWGLLS